MPGPHKIYRNPSPHTHVIVRTKEGDYLRRMRGTVKKAVVNEAFAKQASETCSGAAKQIMMRLAPFTENMFGRIQVYLSGRLRKAFHAKGHTDYTGCLGWEVLKDWPLDGLYILQWKVQQEGDAVSLEVEAGSERLRIQGKEATHYFVEAILVHGDAMIDNHLRVESDRSELFPVTGHSDTTCHFSFVVPEGRQYLLFLKVGVMEGKRPAEHCKYHRMKVVAVR